MKVTIVGSGAIGGLAGSWMAMAGEDVTFCDVNRDHVNAIKTTGIHIDGARDDHYLPPQKACTPDELKGPLECVFLSCKAQHTRDAVLGIQHALGPESFVVSLQNGLINEEVIASIIGPERTVGALPDYGGAYIDPGHIEFVHEGPAYVGELDGVIRVRTRECCRLLSNLTKCEILADIKPRIWAKTTYNSQIIVSALVDQPIDQVLGDETAKRVSGAIGREALEIAYAYGIDIPTSDFYDPKLYFPKTPADTKRLFDRIDYTLKVFRDHQIEQEKTGRHQYVKKASGFWWDIVYRKRKSEVEASHGPLLGKAAAKRIPAPLTARLCKMIYEIEDGKRQMSWDNIRELYEHIKAQGKDLP